MRQAFTTETSHGKGPQALCRSYLWMVILLISVLVIIILRPCPTRANSELTLANIISTHTLRVGVNPDFRPFSNFDSNKQRVGIDLDIAHLLAAQLNVDLKMVVPKQFDDLIPMLQRSEIDIIIVLVCRAFLNEPNWSISQRRTSRPA